MTPDAAWPNLPAHGQFTPADHAAHTTPRGTPTWEQHHAGTSSFKMTKKIMKFASKPHLKMKGPQRGVKRTPTRRKKKDK